MALLESNIFAYIINSSVTEICMKEMRSLLKNPRDELTNARGGSTFLRDEQTKISNSF